MELKDALLKRRSVRKFTEQTVSDEIIDDLMHAAMSGPSACNIKPWEFYVVKDPEKLAKLRKATPYSNMKAPLDIVVVGNITMLPRIVAPYWVQDCSAATENILLRVTDLGLGACWVGVYPSEKAIANVSEILNLKAKQIPLNIIHIGYPDQFPEERDQYNCKKIHII